MRRESERERDGGGDWGRGGEGGVDKLDAKSTFSPDRDTSSGRRYKRTEEREEINRQSESE